MHYNWNRFYDPETGRYISADPIGLAGGMNLYAYVQNNPVNWRDLEGLAPFTNKCDKPICFKPEKTKDGYDGTKKYECPPGQTCDADGVYPPDGSNPYRFCDDCSIETSEEGDECKIQKPECKIFSKKGILCQKIFGGTVPDDWWDDPNISRDWPKPSTPVTPSPKSKQ